MSNMETADYGLVILNPAAGDEEPQEIVAALQDVFGEDGYALYKMSEDEPLCKAIARRLGERNYAWVAAAGGDGTVSIVADCLVGSEHKLAIIPAGTGNVLAQELGIPEDKDAACRLIKQHEQTRCIDAMRVGDRHYFLQVGMGLEALTMRETPSSQKSRWGDLAYLWHAVKEGAEWQPHLLVLTIDGDRHEVEASEVVLANAASIGMLGMSWGEAIVVDDGVIDVVVLQARGPADYVAVLPSLLRGEEQDADQVTIYRARESIRLETGQALPLHGDGEVLKGPWPLEASVVSRAVSVIVP
ncbi:MAG: diacylglycerol/lipid kinase family protein [Candidatus Promineifilaceae bacterium]|jgi:diacylglycerol kinase (ATP)